MSARRIDRRHFLAVLGAAIPGFAAACSLSPSSSTLHDEGEPPKPDSGGPAPREASAPPSDDAGDPGGLDTANDWEKRAAELEAQGPIYTADSPGPWAGKEAGHVPQIVIDGTNVTIKVAHPMHAADDAGPEHYITTIYARDQANKIVWLKEFKVDDPAAETTFALPAGTTALTAYSHCNIHGLWSSRHIPSGNSGATATKNDAWEADVAALERSGVWSATNEGPWPGKAPKHVPTVEGGRGSVLLTVSHEMKAGTPLDAGAPDGGDGGKDGGDAGSVEHYIGRMYVRNQDGLVVGWKSLTTLDPFPIALFDLPLGTTKVTAYAWCNIHGVWKSDTVDVQG
jgi:desulfoferrodoxin (superoxide reductase-like protein)